MSGRGFAGGRVVVLAASLLAAAALAACGGAPKSSSSPSSSSAATTSVGVKVTGTFGQKPTLSVPGTPAPTKLTTDVLTQGTGPAVASGQSLIVNYLGQTWEPKDGKPNVFDNSYDKHQPFAFPLGKKAVISGWDQALVGQTLLFVVDVIAGYDVNATATGTTAAAVPGGFPQVKSASGQVPSVTSVKGVKLTKTPQSALLIQGSGPVIDANKTLVVQLLQVDAKSGKALQSTWTGPGPQPLAAAAALQAVSAFKGAHVGSRAVVLSPAPTASNQQGVVVVVDVLGEF
jgi:peptidylprolyl isomerase